jgi:hypothetical protein
VNPEIYSVKKHVEKAKSPKTVKKNRSVSVNRTVDAWEPSASQAAKIRERRVIQPATVLQLQKQIGNASVQQYLARRKYDEVQIQRKDDEGMTFGELMAKAIMENPKLMAMQAKDILKDVTAVFSGKKPGDAYFTDLETVYWGLFKLVIDLTKMPEGSVTTTEQRAKAEKYAKKWVRIKAGIAADAEIKMRSDLAKAKEGTKKLQIQMLYAYHDIYAAGKEPGDVKMGDGETIKGMAEKVTDLLKSINEADAGISGRSVTPIIPVLDKTLTIVNVITGWKVTKPLAAEASKDMANLQNALSLALAGLSLSGFGKFLPLFGYIGPLLDGIAKGWDRLVSALSKKNRMWWEAREIMGEDLPHPSAEPGGRAVFNYMKKMFKVSSAPSKAPSKSVLEFFYDNKTMLNKAMKEVMGKSWSKVPTRSSWLIFSETNPEKINNWVFYNRDTIWRLIYGRGMKPPEKS